MSPTETDVARAELATPLGEAGSARRRYAAAMSLNRAGLLSDAALEVFRICSPHDGEDPATLLTIRGLAKEVPLPMSPNRETALARLVEEADRYFAGLPGPGIAEVRAGLSQWRNGDLLPTEARANHVLDRWLSRALEQLEATHPALAQAIAQAAPHLCWLTFDGYPLDEIGPDFPAGHAATSIFGETNAPFFSADWDMGLFLMAPDVLYRDHRHAAPELYAPLTGPHGWRFGADDAVQTLPAHVPVWNEPFRPHMTKVGREPFLCLYAWTRDVNAGAEVVPATDWARLESLKLLEIA